MLVAYGGSIVIGDRTSINPFSILYGHGGLQIGSDVLIAAHVTIIPANHRFDKADVPIRKQGETRLGITIGDDVWIGTGARILDGVTVGHGSVVAAGAVVAHDVPPYSVVAGVPARLIKRRGAVLTETRAP
jgi:acetyltransferase-like isoleucine patch superfamily enzyme